MPVWPKRLTLFASLWQVSAAPATHPNSQKLSSSHLASARHAMAWNYPYNRHEFGSTVQSILFAASNRVAETVWIIRKTRKTRNAGYLAANFPRNNSLFSLDGNRF
jgi:hypothetical protein